MNGIQEGGMPQTNVNHLLPVGMIHMGVQHLLAMCQDHPSAAPRDMIEWSPQCLNDFPIHLLCTRDIAWGEARQAGILVVMDVNQAYSSVQFQGVR